MAQLVAQRTFNPKVEGSIPSGPNHQKGDRTMRRMANVEDMIGKTLISIETDEKSPVRSIIFTTAEGERYEMYHIQDCCEDVYLEDVCGDFDDLIGSPLVHSYKSSNRDGITWTFYNFSTNKGSVTLRWCGESNGCYSEEVDFFLLEDDTKEEVHESSAEENTDLFDKKVINFNGTDYQLEYTEDEEADNILEINGKRYRLTRPWYLSGKYHKPDGPAVE